MYSILHTYVTNYDVLNRLSKDVGSKILREVRKRDFRRGHHNKDAQRAQVSDTGGVR